MDDADLREQVEQLEEQLGRLDPQGIETVQGLLRLYGEALRRIVERLQRHPDVLAEIERDELIAHLLVLHELRQDVPEPVSLAIAFGPVVVS